MRTSPFARVLGRHRPRGDSGSMAFYLLIAVVGLALGALAVPMIVTSSQTTRSDTSRLHAVDAAQAGLNVMAGRIRGAQIDGVGTSTLLPCSPVSGDVNGTAPAAYTTSVAYYMNDPVTVPGAVQMRCIAGYGTYDSVSGSFTPRFARITSTGTDGAASSGSTPGRTMQATYVFRTTNGNVVGGQIRIYPPSGSTTSLCMDSGVGTPIAGTRLSLQPCENPPPGRQIFAYRSDLTLQLLSSISSAYPTGLCIDTAQPPATDNPVTLNACLALGVASYSQQWSFNDNGNFEASTSTSVVDGVLANLCIRAPSQTVGALLAVGGCGDTVSTVSAWIPSPSVGAGAAQAPQLVNFYEFGRCLDVTNQKTSTDHLIDYPCKQNPKPTAVAWNQKWTLPAIAPGAASATGAIYTTPSGTNCLTSPGTDNGYTVVPACDITRPTTAQMWTVYNGSSTLPYSTKYTIVDYTGRCLGLTVPAGAETWSAIVVEPCTGATEQKWNATPDLVGSSLQNVRETTNP